MARGNTQVTGEQITRSDQEVISYMWGAGGKEREYKFLRTVRSKTYLMDKEDIITHG